LKFQPDLLEGANGISRHEPGSVWVRNTRHSGSVLVPWRGNVLDWRVSGFDALTEEHFLAVRDLEPELVVFGSGSRLRFASPALMRGLLERRIGVETMDTAAACRTFNVLVSEGRCVVAALVQDAPG
jgi:uncharacterized protein